MAFILSKIILYLILPPSSLLIIMVTGILLLRRKPRLAAILIIGGVAILYLLSISPVSDRLLKPLESSFPPPKDSSIISANTIVILGGGVRDLSWLDKKPAPTDSSIARLSHGITLYRQIPGAKLIISGGNGNLQKTNISESDAMKDMAVALGVAAKDILIERGSRNTIEGVEALKKLIGEKKIILVTSAFHMRRSAAMFRKAGMDVIPAPTDYKSEQQKVSLYDFIPDAATLLFSSTAVYEYMGLAWYRLAGNL